MSPSSRAVWDRMPALLASVTTGAVGGALLVAWQRRCLQVLGPGLNVSAISALVFSIGIVGGIALCQNSKQRGVPILSRSSIEVIIVLAGTVGGQLLAPALNFAASGLAPLRSAASCDVIFSVIVAGVLELLPAAALGALIAPSRRTGFRLAFDLLPAVLGGTASYLFTSLQLLPRWGTLPVFALSVVVLTAVPVLSCGPGEPRWSKVVLQVGLSGVLLFGLGEGLGSAYRYGNPTWPSGDRVEYFRVGRAGDVRVVSSSSRRWIEVNGVAVTSAARERAERALGAIPLLLRPHTTDIFVAGFGGGAAVDACLSWPGTKVVCCEPEPALVTAACVFRGTGQPSLTNQHFSLVHRDARTTLVRINDRFDVVLLDVANPRLPGGTRFFAAEFYKEAKLRLTPGGILCHRVHVDSLTPSGLALMSRTLTESFPFVALVPVSDVDALLIGSRHPVIESTEGIRDAQRRLDRLPFLCGQLQSDFQSTNVARLCTRLLWLDRDGLRLLGQADGKTSLAGSWTPWWNGKLATRGWAADDASMQSRLIASSARVGTFQRNGELNTAS